MSPAHESEEAQSELIDVLWRTQKAHARALDPIAVEIMVCSSEIETAPCTMQREPITAQAKAMGLSS